MPRSTTPLAATRETVRRLISEVERLDITLRFAKLRADAAVELAPRKAVAL